MTTDKIYSVLTMMELEVGYLRSYFWEYKSGLKTEAELIIAFNKFTASTGCVCREEIQNEI